MKNSIPRYLLFIFFMLGSYLTSCQKEESSITSVSIPDEVTLNVGNSMHIEASHFPSNLPTPILNWFTSDASIITVNNKGEITALRVGEATLTVKIPELNLSATCIVKVLPINAEYIIVQPTKVELKLGDFHQLEAIILPENTTDKNVKWESSNDKIIKVTNNGVIEAKAVGKAVIKASTETAYGICEVDINPIKVEKVMLSKESIDLYKGSTYKLIAKIEPENTTDKSIIWSSNDENIVTVSEEGLVTGVGVGKSFITATAGTILAKCEVKVDPVDMKINLTNPGTLSSFLTPEQKLNIESLTLTGTLNEYDFLFIHEMSHLKWLDISLISNTSLPDKLFENNTVIEKVNLPNNLMKIPERIFSGSSIKECIIPSKVESIERFAFNHSKLSGILIIPPSVEIIGEGAFAQCDFISGLKFNEGLKHIGRLAFHYIEGNLIEQKDLIIPSTVEHIGFQAFLRFKGISGDLTILGKNTVIEAGAFANCTDFDGKLTVNANIIESDAFYNCSNFKKLLLEEGITIIKDRVFYKCNQLTGVLKLPSTLIEIGLAAFNSLTGLSGDLVLPENLEKMSTQAFQNCTGFDKIYSKNKNPPSLPGLDIFPNYKYLGVPFGTKEVYRNASGYKPNYEKWSNFIVIEEVDFDKLGL